MNIHFIKTPEKREIISELNEQFGITELPYLLIQAGKDKIGGFSGHLSKDETMEISQIANIEIIGLYLLKKEDNFRLSMDAASILKKQINKNIIEIDNEQIKDWMRGHDLDIKTQRGVIIIKNNEDFIGCGKSNGEKVFNYVPKDRRLRK